MRRTRCLRCVLAVLGVLCAASRPARRRGRRLSRASRSASVQLVLEGRETTEPVADRRSSRRVAGQPLSMIQVRETRRAPLQPRPVRGRQRRRRARGRPRRAALRADPDSSGGEDPLRRTARRARASIRASCAARIVDRYGVSPPLGRAADMTRILADALRERGYLNAVGDAAAGARARAGARDAGVRDRARAADDDRRRRDRRRADRSPRPSCSARLGVVGRRAVSARGAERPHRELHRRAAQQGLLRGADRCRWCGCRPTSGSPT